MTRVAFLGGNGHCAARLAPARRFAAGLELADVPYPGFEGRPRADDLASFLDDIAAALRAPALVYATGIGGLLALALLPTELRTAFFDGYARCAALPDLFAWLTPALLRRLERDLVGRAGALDRIMVWWGQQDRVIGTGELRRTREALGVDWPLRIFPDWGHYPMIDEPEVWVAELRAFLSEP